MHSEYIYIFIYVFKDMSPLNFNFVVPAEFQNDPIKKMNIDISQRPEMRSAMIEYIVPHGYKVR